NAVLQLLLTPQSGPTQTVESWSLEMAGIGNAGRFVDAFGNVAHLVNQSRPEGALEVTAKGVVRTSDRHGVLGRVGGEPVPALYKRITPLTKAPASLYGKFRGSKESRLNVLHGLMARVGELLETEEPGQTQSQMAADGSQSQSQSQGGESKPRAGAAGYAMPLSAAHGRWTSRRAM
ncbi:MAG TPA: transglutaminase N-terminal domain-containing protein, partial [Devosia sp.]|nr:transglutaminase N-terminal domain-containing protein [Devosia sp.]